MRKIIIATAIAVSIGQQHSAEAAVTAAPGYIYARQVLSELTQFCVAHAQGGLFVGQGPPLTFPASGGTQSIVFVTESGDTRTVATGLNAIEDCVYDAATDTLYVTDDGLEFTGATTGDTVFAIPGDSENVPIEGLEVLPSGSIPRALSITLFGDGLLVSDATGGGEGSVIEIDLSGATPAMSTFASGFEYTGGLAVGGSGVLIAEATADFQSVIYDYSTAGVRQSTVSGPTFDHGSIDLAIAADGGILAVGIPTLVSLDEDANVTPLVTGIDGGTNVDAFGGNVSVDPFTGRIDFQASTYTGADDDKSIHRLVPIDHLVPGGGRASANCAMEFYGIELVPAMEGRPARSAICVDGAPCDADGAVDGGCTFPLGICLRVDDPAIPDCTPTDVASVELVTAKPESEQLTALVEAAAAVLPAAQSECVFGDGIRVELRTATDGSERRARAVVKLRAVTAQDPPRADMDIARLVCRPAA